MAYPSSHCVLVLILLCLHNVTYGLQKSSLFLFTFQSIVYKHCRKSDVSTLQNEDRYGVESHSKPIIVSKLQMIKTQEQDIGPERDTSINTNSMLSKLLAVSYTSIIISIMTLPACLSGIADDQIFQSKTLIPLSSLISVSTMATMIGKFILAPPTDKFGGMFMLIVGMISTSAFLLGCATSKSINTFSIYWVAFSFIYASAWGAVGQVVREKFPQSRWGNQLGLVAAGSRLGSMLSSLIFGLVLNFSTSWRSVYYIGAYIQGLIALGIIYLNDNNDKKETNSSFRRTDVQHVQTLESQETPFQAIKRVSKQSKFWCMLLAKVSLMLTGQFINFLPLYFKTGVNLSPGKATACSSLFALGSFLSSVKGTQWLQNVEEKNKANAMLKFNITSLILSLILFANCFITSKHGVWLNVPRSIIPIPILLSTIFLWGVSWALPFYIPPGVMALKLGGLRHAALFTNLYDAVGFFAASMFSLPAGRLGSKGNWTPVFGILTLANVLAVISMYWAMCSDYQDHPIHRLTLEINPSDEILTFSNTTSATSTALIYNQTTIQIDDPPLLKDLISISSQNNNNSKSKKL